MDCTVFRLSSGPQTGKTTIAIGALQRAKQLGGKVLLIVENEKVARMVRSRQKIDMEIAPASKIQPYMLSAYNAVAIDIDCFPYTEADLEIMRKEMSKNQGPAFLIVTSQEESQGNGLERPLVEWIGLMDPDEEE